MFPLQPQSVLEQLKEEKNLPHDMTWVGLINALHFIMTDKESHYPVLLKRFLEIWNAVTTVVDRKKALCNLKDCLGHKEVRHQMLVYTCTQDENIDDMPQLQLLLIQCVQCSL